MSITCVHFGTISFDCCAAFSLTPRMLAHSEPGSPMPRTLADRLRSHAQQKARLAEREMQLKEAERKARTGADPGRRPCRKSGTAPNQAQRPRWRGAILARPRRQRRTDPEWAALGGRAFAREARAEDEAKEPVAVSFPAPVARGVAEPSAPPASGSIASARNGKAAPISIKPRPSQKTTAAPSAASVQRPWQRPLNRARQRLPRVPM